MSSLPAISVGDILGFLALILIGLTSVLMLVRRRLLRRVKNLNALRRVHVLLSGLAGLFLVLHIAYFISFPISDGIVLGYVSTAAALVVWLTGTAFLERFRDSLFYHGSLSLGAFALMLMHASVSGINIPSILAEALLVSVIVTVLVRASSHLGKLFAARSPSQR